jgi:uncharacterized protein (UPF0254 family)
MFKESSGTRLDEMRSRADQSLDRVLYSNQMLDKNPKEPSATNKESKNYKEADDNM